MNRIVGLLSLVLFLTTIGYSQVSINEDGTESELSAMLDVKSSDKGFLPPRVSSVFEISSPAAGLLVFDENTNCMRYYNGCVWSECLGHTFSCGDALIDDRDGKSYSTVQIGDQCWMAENLNIGTKINAANNQSNNDIIEKYCIVDDVNFCDVNGGLYQWEEMMQYTNTSGTKGICPTGWHIPTDAEWKTMEMHLGLTQAEADATGTRGTDEGGKMKEKGNDHWVAPNTGATNYSGFTARGGGYRRTDGAFTHYPYRAYFWTSDMGGAAAWYRNLFYNKAGVLRNTSSSFDYGFSVRCLRD